MNNFRLLITLLFVVLSSLRGISYPQLLLMSSSAVVLSVDDMFRLVDVNSKQLQPLLTGITEAEEEIKVAKSAKLPELNASLSFSYLGNSFTTERDFSDFQDAPMPHYGNNFAFEAEQVVYAGGAISNGIKMAELKRDIAILSAEKTRSAMRFMAMGYYLDIFKYRNLLAVIDKNIEQTQKVLSEMQAKSTEGIVLKNDVTRYELLLSNLQFERTRICNTLEILNNNLCAKVGLSSTNIILPDSTILDKSLPSTNSEHWQVQAKENSTTLKIAEIGIKMSQKTEDIVKAERLPQIGLFAGYKMDGPITIEVPPIDRNFNYWYVGLGIKYNLSSLYKTNKRLSKSKIATYKAREEYDATQELVSLEIKADYTRYLEAYEELKTQQKSVELATQNYETTYNRYRNDIALLTDMLDASNAKLDAEQKLVNSQINIIYYYYKLLYTSGTL